MVHGVQPFATKSYSICQHDQKRAKHSCELSQSYWLRMLLLLLLRQGTVALILNADAAVTSVDVDWLWFRILIMLNLARDLTHMQ